mmetsp:Transcript_8072/g.15126  ORF Transcript_8072/g.15126 Transcript_8072/m.15126 type:complete len:354 (-) Transcript_8072:79-1140(-)
MRTIAIVLVGVAGASHRLKEKSWTDVWQNNFIIERKKQLNAAQDIPCLHSIWEKTDTRQDASAKCESYPRKAFLRFLLAFSTRSVGFNPSLLRVQIAAGCRVPAGSHMVFESKQNCMVHTFPVMHKKDEVNTVQPVISDINPSLPSSSSSEHDRIRNSCLTWVTDFVVKHHLCPWAKGALSHLEFRIIDTPPINDSSDNDDIEDFYAELMSLAEGLMEAQEHPDSERKTTTMLIALPQYHDFMDFLDVSSVLVKLFESSGISDFVQVATFHPDYRFRDEESAVSAYTNRSPYPMLHYLLVSEVSKAIENYAKDGRNSGDIWQDNIVKMNNLATELGGEKGMQHVLEKMCQHSE